MKWRKNGKYHAVIKNALLELIIAVVAGRRGEDGLHLCLCFVESQEIRRKVMSENLEARGLSRVSVADSET